MTREDAIKILKEYAPRVKPFYEPFRTEYPQAIEMAIESLSAEASAETHGVCSDIISREEVLRVIITAGEVEPDLGYTHLHDVIKSLPSVEPKTGKWVSEKRRYKSEDGNDYTYFISHCSECGVRRRIGWQGVAFCPNCGARMDEGGDTE